MLQRHLIFLTIAFLMPVASVNLNAQSGSALSLEKIMAGDEWIGYQPGNPWWSGNSKHIYFQWNTENYPSDSIYRYNFETGQTRKLSSPESSNLPSRQYFYDSDRRRKVYTRNGDLFLRDVKSGETLQLTNTLQSVSSPCSSPIYFAEGLEGALLMCHGMVDDNVHFQDIVRLTQRFI